MSIARILQWPIRLPLLSAKRRSKSESAKETARKIEDLGELRVTYFSQHIGYINLGVESKNSGARIWVKITHNLHFRGRYTKVPELEKAKYIRFKSRTIVLPYGDPKEFSSYLEIEKVR